MFSKNHVEAMLQRARMGETVDLDKEVRFMPMMSIVVTKDMRDFIVSNGSFYYVDGQEWWIYQSNRFKYDVIK